MYPPLSTTELSHIIDLLEVGATYEWENKEWWTLILHYVLCSCVHSIITLDINITHDFLHKVIKNFKTSAGEH